MVIYTSYFANIDKIRKEIPDAILIAISKEVPDSIVKYIDKHEPLLGPNKTFFKEYKFNNDLYDREVKFIKSFILEIIDNNLDNVINKWNKMYLSKTLVLLCYEKPTDFCHRQIVAEFIEERTNLNVFEYGYENSERKNYRIIVKSSMDEEW